MAGRSTGAHAENSQSAGIRQRPGTGYFISDAGIVALALFAHGFGSAAEKKRKYGILTGKNTADDAIYCLLYTSPDADAGAADGQ